MRQKGFGHILVILGVLIAVGVSAEVFYFSSLKNTKLQPESTVMAADPSPQPENKSPKLQTPSPIPTPVLSPKPIILRQTFTSTEHAFTFTYPAVLEIQTDSEEEYSKRFGGDARQNFTSYVKYSPGRVLFSAAVLGKDSSFETAAFTIWIFDNPNQLTMDVWFDKYWYYPFLWGVFDKTSKGHATPDKEATISGTLAKYKTVSYQESSPKYLYLAKGSKMFLIRVLTAADQTGENILQSLKFIN